ncbi:hypothetical protein [Streptomyces sp. NPDC058045]|uniref:hypothetical protein n=1 Tax=Streptomyces sp. NPDC058045 TaxID=3346311 RepID=UPI0036E8E9AA
MEANTLHDLEEKLAATFAADDWSLDAASVSDESGFEVTGGSVRPVSMDLNDLLGSRPVGN